MVINNNFEINGPVDGKVQAWAKDYIHYKAPTRPDWQGALATEIRTRCAQFEPEKGQLLSAIFFGEKRDDADVENLVLYNIGSFGKAGDNGIRFEHGTTIPFTLSGIQYPFCYRYDLVSESSGFGHWQSREKLASFDWVDLGELKGEKLAAPVWLALARACESGQAEVFFSNFTPGTEFAVKVHIRPPGKHTRTLANMVKGIIDGLVSAFQAHTDMTILEQVIPPLASTIQTASPALKSNAAEIERHLREQGRGVLGEVAQLISPYRGSSFAFAPDDHLCVAGELLRDDPPSDQHWAIKGEVVEVSPRKHT